MFQKVLKVQIWLSRLCQWLKIVKYIFYIYILHIYIHIYMCVPCIMLWCWKHFKDGSLKRRFCCQAQMVIRGTVFGTWTLASFSAHEIAVWCNYSQCEFSTKSDRKGKTMGVCFKETLEMDTCSTCAAVCWASKIQLMSPLILRLTASYHIYCNLSQVIEHCLQSRRHLKPLEWSGIFL